VLLFRAVSTAANPVVGKRYGLGLQPHSIDPRDLLLSDYWDYTLASSTAGSPEPGRKYGHAALVDGKMGVLLNDEVGDCFIADTMHALEVLDLLGGHTPDFGDLAARKAYMEFGWNGTDKGTGTDQGCEPREGLKHFQKVGLPREAGSYERIGSYLWLDSRNPEQLEAATREFDWTGVAYELTENAEDEAESGQWRYVPGSPKIGGHWVAVVGGEADGEFDTLTWGLVEAVERLYYERCSQAAATSLSHSQLDGTGKTPEGFDFEKLQHDLEALRA
jgi:hypothetical protein